MTESMVWYAQIIKPEWAPPSWLFGPVWTVLYILIGISFGYVFSLYITKKVPLRVVIPFVLNLIFNFAFSPIQFGLQNLTLAAVDVVLVWLTLVWSLAAWYRAYPQWRWVVYVNIPYVLWVSFATVLQITVTTLNW